MEIPKLPEWLPTFGQGWHHSFIDCEVLALERIDREQLEADWTAAQGCWFDYVRLHPVKAFYYFMHCYGRAYGVYLEQAINMELRFNRGYKGDPLESRELKQFLLIKREADKRGIPYDVWLPGIFKHFASSGWTRPPRPAHIANSIEAMTLAEEDWHYRILGYTRYAADPWFKADAWVGHPQQQRYEDWIVGNLKLRENKDLALSVAVYETGSLRIERAVQEFTEEQLLQAQDWFDRTNR